MLLPHRLETPLLIANIEAPAFTPTDVWFPDQWNQDRCLRTLHFTIHVSGTSESVNLRGVINVTGSLSKGSSRWDCGGGGLQIFAITKRRFYVP
jgi:hypothetical protein